MSERKFQDDRGRRWRVVVRGRRDWRFEPLPGNPAPARSAEPPLYADDPFELSGRELRKILAGASPAPGEAKPGGSRVRPPSPFLDDREPGARGDEEPGPPSPFGD